MFENHDLSPSYSPIDRNMLAVYNSSDTPIRACTAVSLTGRTVLNIGGYEQVIFGGIPATDDSGIWGIAAEDIAPGTAGSMVISGIVRAFITAGSGNYVIPGGSGLIASGKGRHLILYRGNENNPGWIMMNCSNAAADYSGSFKLRYVRERTFEIYHSSFPEITSNANSNYAGFTDLPGADKVPRQFLTLPDGQTYADVRLYACCNDGVYSAVIHFEPQEYPAGRFDYYAIGTIRESGEVNQVFTAGGTIYFGRDWFL